MTRTVALLALALALALIIATAMSTLVAAQDDNDDGFVFNKDLALLDQVHHHPDELLRAYLTLGGVNDAARLYILQCQDGKAALAAKAKPFRADRVFCTDGFHGFVALAADVVRTGLPPSDPTDPMSNQKALETVEFIPGHDLRDFRALDTYKATHLLLLNKLSTNQRKRVEAGVWDGDLRPGAKIVSINHTVDNGDTTKRRPRVSATITLKKDFATGEDLPAPVVTTVFVYTVGEPQQGAGSSSVVDHDVSDAQVKFPIGFPSGTTGAGDFPSAQLDDGLFNMIGNEAATTEIKYHKLFSLTAFGKTLIDKCHVTLTIETADQGHILKTVHFAFSDEQKADNNKKVPDFEMRVGARTDMKKQPVWLTGWSPSRGEPVYGFPPKPAPHFDTFNLPDDQPIDMPAEVIIEVRLTEAEKKKHGGGQPSTMKVVPQETASAAGGAVPGEEEMP